jgi:hypothetical protein
MSTAHAFAIGLLAACDSRTSSAEQVGYDLGRPDVPPLESVPVWGGTLETAHAIDGYVAADPEGNRLFVGAGVELHTVDLGTNARPFRVLVEEDLAWVTLRGSGELAQVDLNDRAVDWRARVCDEPRGVAHPWATEPLYVACAGGEIVEVSLDGDVLRSVFVEPDLRDLVPVAGRRLYVSRFASAEVLSIDQRSLTVGGRVHLHERGHVAWRMRPDPVGGVVVAHQVVTPVPVMLPPEDAIPEDVPPAYGTSLGNVCGSPTRAVLTRVPPQTFGEPGYAYGIPEMITSSGLGNLVVVPDFAIAPDGVDATLVAAGASSGGVAVSWFYSFEDMFKYGEGSCLPGGQVHVHLPGRASAVGYDADGTRMVQSAGPFGLAMAPITGGFAFVDEEPTSTTEGHTLFHQDPGSGIACASCHPEGTDDGNVWSFVSEADPDTVMLRRTMSLAGGLLSRAPYHWDGADPDAHALMQDVFVTRMGGSLVDSEMVEDLFAWLDGLRPVHVTAHASPEVVESGRAVFETSGRPECHAGPEYTTNTLEQVRANVPAVKTPSLLGVGVRESLFHDGCASTLEDRFGPSCDAPIDPHGDFSGLSSTDFDALLAFVRSL